MIKHQIGFERHCGVSIFIHLWNVYPSWQIRSPCINCLISKMYSSFFISSLFQSKHNNNDHFICFFFFRAHYESQYMWIVKGTLIFFSLLINQRTIFHLRPRFLHSHFSNYIKAHRNPCFSSSTTFISLIFTVQSNPMFLRIFIGCCLLAIVCCVPVNKTTSTAATKPASTPILPDIDIPDAIAEKSSFERLGKFMN